MNEMSVDLKEIASDVRVIRENQIEMKGDLKTLLGDHKRLEDRVEDNEKKIEGVESGHDSRLDSLEHSRTAIEAKIKDRDKLFAAAIAILGLAVAALKIFF